MRCVRNLLKRIKRLPRLKQNSHKRSVTEGDRKASEWEAKAKRQFEDIVSSKHCPMAEFYDLKLIAFQVILRASEQEVAAQSQTIAYHKALVL